MIAGIFAAISSPGINALGFVGTNYAFNKSSLGDAEVECKQHDLAKEKIQKAKGK